MMHPFEMHSGANGYAVWESRGESLTLEIYSQESSVKTQRQWERMSLPSESMQFSNRTIGSEAYNG